MLGRGPRDERRGKDSIKILQRGSEIRKVGRQTGYQRGKRLACAHMDISLFLLKKITNGE